MGCTLGCGKGLDVGWKVGIVVGAGNGCELGDDLGALVGTVVGCHFPAQEGKVGVKSLCLLAHGMLRRLHEVKITSTHSIMYAQSKLGQEYPVLFPKS